MWLAKITIKHNCLIGNKCEKFKVSTLSVPFNLYMDGNTTYSPEFHILFGSDTNVKKFIAALKKDRQIQNVEDEGNKVFLVEVTSRKIPVSIRAYQNQKIIWTRPIHINIKGEESWEIASWDKKYITNFIEETKKISRYVILESIKETKIADMYYSRLLPNLSPKQKEAITLALEEGYFDWPKKTDLHILAHKMKMSVAAYREHLRKAEKKLLPDLIRQI